MGVPHPSRHHNVPPGPWSTTSDTGVRSRWYAHRRGYGPRRKDHKWRRPQRSEELPPLGAVGGLGLVLKQHRAGVGGGHETKPLLLRDVGQAGSDRVGCASDPPSNGMVQTVSITWHAHDGSRMHGLPEPTVGPLGQRDESIPGINTKLDYRNEERENMCFSCRAGLSVEEPAGRAQALRECGSAHQPQLPRRTPDQASPWVWGAAGDPDLHCWASPRVGAGGGVGRRRPCCHCPEPWVKRTSRGA